MGVASAGLTASAAIPRKVGLMASAPPTLGAEGIDGDWQTLQSRSALTAGRSPPNLFHLSNCE